MTHRPLSALVFSTTKSILDNLTYSTGQEDRMKWVILCKLFSIQQGRAFAALPCCFPVEKDPCAESLEMPSSKTHSIGRAYPAFSSCFIQNRLIALGQALHSVPRRKFPQNDRICGTCPLPCTRKDNTRLADVPPRTSPHGTFSPMSMINRGGNVTVDNLLRYYGDSLKYGYSG